jgi:hypothetical protein
MSDRPKRTENTSRPRWWRKIKLSPPSWKPILNGIGIFGGVIAMIILTNVIAGSNGGSLFWVIGGGSFFLFLAFTALIVMVVLKSAKKEKSYERDGESQASGKSGATPTASSASTPSKTSALRTIFFLVGLLVLGVALAYLGMRFAYLGVRFVHQISGINGASNKTSPAPSLQPIVNQVCDDAFTDSAPTATTEESATVSIPQGCFGSDTQLPPATAWPSWCYQPYPRHPAAPGWQVTFQFLDGNGRVWATKGPYGPMDKPYFPNFPGRFRIQGSGMVRFYAGDCPCT